MYLVDARIGVTPVIVLQAVTQFRDDDTSITTAKGDVITAEAWVHAFFGGEYKYSNRWYEVVKGLTTTAGDKRDVLTIYRP